MQKLVSNILVNTLLTNISSRIVHWFDHETDWTAAKKAIVDEEQEDCYSWIGFRIKSMRYFA